MPAATSRTGSAGAFHTAAQLAQRGWDASLTLGNAPRTDIVAQHAETQRLIAVQCKARTGKADFMLSKGCEHTSPPGRDEWFVLVTLRGRDRRPDFYVMPRNAVAAYVYVGHRAWLTGTKRDGTARRDNPARNIELAVAPPYLERWDLLDNPADAAPYWLPDWFFDWVPHVGLPPGHPGVARPSDGVPRAGLVGWVPPPPSAPPDLV
jgi:hypothetical protein